MATWAFSITPSHCDPRGTEYMGIGIIQSCGRGSCAADCIATSTVAADPFGTSISRRFGELLANWGGLVSSTPSTALLNRLLSVARWEIPRMGGVMKEFAGRSSPRHGHFGHRHESAGYRFPPPRSPLGKRFRSRHVLYRLVALSRPDTDHFLDCPWPGFGPGGGVNGPTPASPPGPEVFSGQALRACEPPVKMIRIWCRRPAPSSRPPSCQPQRLRPATIARHLPEGHPLGSTSCRNRVPPRRSLYLRSQSARRIRSPQPPASRSPMGSAL